MVGGRWLNNSNLVGGRLLFWSVVGFFHSHWSVVGGFSDRWLMVPLVGGRWSVVDGLWSVVCGRWSVVGGRWSVVGGFVLRLSKNVLFLSVDDHIQKFLSFELMRMWHSGISQDYRCEGPFG